MYSRKKKLLVWMAGAIAGMMILMAMMMTAMMALNNASATSGDADFAAKNPDRIPHFSEVESGFSHQYRGHIAQPVLDMISFDPYGNGTQAIAITGGEGQSDAVLIFEGGSFRNVASEIGLAVRTDDISYAMATADIDGDGNQELIIGRQSGVYVYSRSGHSRTFTERKIDIPLPEDAVPVGLVVSDTTHSGRPDIFIATFIDHRKHSTANFHDPDKRVSNAFWRNNGDGTFRDASTASGLALHHNSFSGRFVDLNGDGYDDLVLATNTAQAYAFENLRDGTFKPHVLPVGYGFWMGAVVGDITGNGQPDIFLSNAGTAVPRFMMKGDLEDGQELDTSYRLLEGDGKFGFKDVTEKFGLASPSFGWGMAIADFTNNGNKEIVVTENFIGMPLNIQKYLPSGGAMMVVGPEGKYQNTVRQSGVVNERFGYRALAIDLNGNGYNDLLIANVDGPLRVFMNNGKGN